MTHAFLAQYINPVWFKYLIRQKSESEDVLLEQLRRVPLSEYRNHRRHLAQAEAPHQFFCRLNRDPGGTIQKLMASYRSTAEQTY